MWRIKEVMIPKPVGVQLTGEIIESLQKAEAALDEYLRYDWEPYAVVEGKQHISYYLKKKVPLLPERRQKG